MQVRVGREVDCRRASHSRSVLSLVSGATLQPTRRGGGSVIELLRLHHYHRYSRIRVVMVNPFHKVSRRGDLSLNY